MPYSPTDPPEQIAANIAAAFAARVVDQAGIATAEPYEPEHVPRRLPAIQMFGPVQTEINEQSPLGHSEWAFHWRLDLYVVLTDYQEAQAEMSAIVPRLLRLPRAERAEGGPILDGTCDEWAVFDAGEDPNPDNKEQMLYKELRLRAVALTVP
jgi:hypothetical protein